MLDGAPSQCLSVVGLEVCVSWRGTVSHDRKGNARVLISCKLLSHLEHHCKYFSFYQWQIRNILFQVVCDGYLMPSEHRVDAHLQCFFTSFFWSASGSSEAPTIFPLIPDFPVLTMHSFRAAWRNTGLKNLWEQMECGTKELPQFKEHSSH